MTESMDFTEAGEVFDSDRIRSAVQEILISKGEDPKREGLIDTPNRVVELYRDIFSGLRSSKSFFDTDTLYFIKLISSKLQIVNSGCKSISILN